MTWTRRALVFVVAWLGAARGDARAETPEKLSLDDVLAAVDAAHPLLGAAKARVEAARSERQASAGGLDPSVKAKLSAKPGAWDAEQIAIVAPLRAWGGDVGLGWSRGQGNLEPWQGDLATAAPGELVATWTLPTLRDAWTDRRRVALRRADLEQDVAALDARSRTLEVRRTAASRYADWVATGARLRVADGLLELARARDQAFAAQVDLGDAAKLIRLDSRRLVLERTDRQIQARRALEQARIELSLHLRDGDGRRVLADDALLPERVAAPLPLPDLDEAVTRARSNRPEIARLDLQITQAELDRRLQSNQALPSVDVLGEHRQPLDGSKPEWKFGAQSEWTLGARAARGRGGVAIATQDRLRDELRFAEDRVVADVLDAHSASLAARTRLSVTQELVSTARQVAVGERAKLDLGDSNLIFVNQREIAVADAELLLIDAELAAYKASIDLAWAQATLGGP